MLGGSGRWLGGALLILGAILFGRSTRHRAPAPTADGFETASDSPPSRAARWAEVLGLVVITAIAAAFRLYRLADLPPGLAPEEASLGLAATTSLSGPGG